MPIQQLDDSRPALIRRSALALTMAILGLSILPGCATTSGEVADGSSNAESGTDARTASSADPVGEVQDRVDQKSNDAINKTENRVDSVIDRNIDRGLGRIFGD